MKDNRNPAEAEEDRGVSAREAARMVGVTPQWIRTMTRGGEFVRPIRIGRRRLRFSLVDVLAWIESRKQAA